MAIREHPNRSAGSRRDVIVVSLISVALLVPAAELTLRALCAYCSWTEQNNEGFVSPYAIREDSWYLLLLVPPPAWAAAGYPADILEETDFGQIDFPYGKG